MTVDTHAAAVRSSDGSTLATFATGRGPLLVIVDPALGLAQGNAGLVAALADSFTVVCFDRRGRGGSDDRSPDSADPQREVEDIAAVVAAHGGRAVLFGSSSGAAVALGAAAGLGDRVSGLVLFEPPFIVDDGHPPLPADLAARIAAEVARDERGQAVETFFTQAVGVPDAMVAGMRQSPMWEPMAAIAHSLRYDFAALAGTQTGMPLPAGRWAQLVAPGVVLVGSESPAYFHTGARALADAVGSLRYEVLQGANHAAPQLDPEGLAARIIDEFA